MFNNIISFSSYQFHLEKAKLVVDAIQFIDHRPCPFVFLGVFSVNSASQVKVRTNIKNELSDNMFIREIFIVEVDMCLGEALGIRVSGKVKARTYVPCHRKTGRRSFSKLFRKESM